MDITMFLFSVLVLSFLFSLLLSQFKWSNWKSSKKKEPRLPGIHNLFQLIWYWLPRWGMANYLALEDAFKLWGPVCQIKVGNCEIVAVSEIQLAKKIMASPEWMNRLPDGHFIYERSFKKPLGLLFGNDENWTHCREFTTKILHKLGFGDGAGTSMEAYIEIEVEETLQKLDKIVTNDGGILRPHCFFHVPTLNILWRLLARAKISEDDPKIKKLLKYFYKWNRSFNFGATPLYIFSCLRHIPFVTEHDVWVKGHQKFARFFQGIMEERLESRSYKEEPLDFIDYFLVEMEAHKNDETNYFTEQSFLTICTDLFMAAADTTSNSLEFAILLMTLNQKAQKKVQHEIDDVIGADRLPSLIYKNRMIWTEVTTLEILRHSCAIPITGRCPLADMRVNECPVAKGSQVAINIHAIHFSEQLWTDPLAFRPERFLSPDGNKIINTDKIMPFGYGKRKCVGEAMSRNSFFLFFTGMLQKFSFSLSPHHSPPPKGDVCGLSRAPRPYTVLVKRRSDDNPSR